MTAVSGSRRSMRRSSESGGAQQAVFSAGRGLALILVAIVIGIVLLYVVDDGSSGPASESTATTAATNNGGGTGTTAAPASSTTAAAAARPPAEVKIKVLNAGRPTGSAAKMTDQLRTRGYTNALGPGDTAKRAGTVVSCKEGYDGADAAALATAVASNAKVEPFPNPAPDVGDANCIVILGT